MPAALSLSLMMIKAAAADRARSAVAVAVALADGKLLLLNMSAALSPSLLLKRDCCWRSHCRRVAAANVAPSSPLL
jgi:hypothetical protein